MSDSNNLQHIRSTIRDLGHAVGALHARLKDAGLLDCGDKVLPFQMLRVQKELAAAWGHVAPGDLAYQQTNWQQAIKDLTDVEEPTPRNEWTEYFVVVTTDTPVEELHGDDIGITGVYSVTADPKCISPATAVLDAFHGRTGIACLDDFSIEVIDPATGLFVPEVDGIDSYSMEDHAEFNGCIMAVDELPDVLKATSSAQT